MTTLSNQQSPTSEKRHWIDSRGSDDKPSVAWFSEGHLCHAFLAKEVVTLIADGLFGTDKATTKVSVKDVVKASANRDEDWVNISHHASDGKQDNLILHLKNAAARDDFLSVLQNRAGLQKTVTNRRVPWIDATIVPLITTASIAALIFLFYFIVPEKPTTVRRPLRIPAYQSPFAEASPTSPEPKPFPKTIPRYVEEDPPRQRSFTAAREELIQDLVNKIGSNGVLMAGLATLFVGGVVIYWRGRNRPEEQLIVLNRTPG